MNKSVLVMKTPEKGCISCLIGRYRSDRVNTSIYCPIAGKLAIDEETESIPDWCPLRALPEKRKTNDAFAACKHDPVYAFGWNACIDEITGGEVDGEINGLFDR